MLGEYEFGGGKKTGRGEDDPSRCDCWELCWLCGGGSRDPSAQAGEDSGGKGRAWDWWTPRTVFKGIVTKNCVHLLVGVDPMDTAEPRGKGGGHNF